MPRTRSKKHSTPTNVWIAPALKLGTIAMLSPIVASRRILDVYAGKSSQEEATRMVTEKISAFNRGLMDASVEMLRSQLSLTAAMWGAAAFSHQTASVTKRRMASKTRQARFARTLAGMTDRAFSPVARTVKANSKRLTGTKT